MKKMLIIIAMVLLGLGFNYGASAWIYVPDYGDTGWQTYTYTAPGGFAGTAGFVVSNAFDSGTYSELLLDNLSRGGGIQDINRGFEQVSFSGYDLVGASTANVSTSEQAVYGNTYNPTQSEHLAVIQGLYNTQFNYGVTTSLFSNASGQSGTGGSILETAITLGDGETFSFDWAFLANDMSPWNDFALFYLKDQSGAIVFSEGLAQIGSGVPIPSSVLLLGSGLLGLLGLARKGKRQAG